MLVSNSDLVDQLQRKRLDFEENLNAKKILHKEKQGAICLSTHLVPVLEMVLRHMDKVALSCFQVELGQGFLVQVRLIAWWNSSLTPTASSLT